MQIYISDTILNKTDLHSKPMFIGKYNKDK